MQPIAADCVQVLTCFASAAVERAALAVGAHLFVKPARGLASGGTAFLAVLDTSAVIGAEQLDDVALVLLCVAVQLVFDLLVDVGALIVRLLRLFCLLTLLNYYCYCVLVALLLLSLSEHAVASGCIYVVVAVVLALLAGLDHGCSVS